MTALKLWPDAQDILLLRAALGEDDAALAAFAEWQRGVDWDGEIEGGSFRLLPLLHANLARLGCDDRLMGRLAGVYRHSWCEAQTHLQRGARAMALLRRHDIPVLVSKGLALAVAYYQSPAHRPMSDIDLVVPVDRASEALAVLGDAGWLPAPAVAAQWAGREPDLLALNIGLGLQHPRDGEIDLHWRLMHESGRAALETGFWDRAVPIRIGGIDGFRPAPGHLLMHVIVHGLRPNALSPLRWVADAAMILRRDGAAIDWADMLACARQLRVAQRLDKGLHFLKDTMALDIPHHVATGTIVPGWVERIENRLFSASIMAVPPQRQKQLASRAYLARLMVSDARRHVPRLALQRLGRRLVRRLVPAARASEGLAQ